MTDRRTLLTQFSRRRMLMGTAGFAAAAGAGVLPSRLLAQEPISVAGIYTVPVEQQWVSRIHIAAEAAKAAGQISYSFSENTANTDYPRVMREYAEAGAKLIVGEIFGVEQEAESLTHPAVEGVHAEGLGRVLLALLADPAEPLLAGEQEVAPFAAGGVEHQLELLERLLGQGPIQAPLARAHGDHPLGPVARGRRADPLHVALGLGQVDGVAGLFELGGEVADR